MKGIMFIEKYGSDKWDGVFLIFTLDLKDGKIPHIIPVVVFFDIIKKRDFTIKDLYDNFI